MAQLRVKNSSVIDKLYDKNLNSCPNCGLRIEASLYPAHLDEHYRQNKKKKKKIQENVGNFLSYNEWVEGQTLEEVHETRDNDENKGKELQVTYDESHVNSF